MPGGGWGLGDGGGGGGRFGGGGGGLARGGDGGWSRFELSVLSHSTSASRLKGE